VRVFQGRAEYRATDIERKEGDGLKACHAPGQRTAIGLTHKMIQPTGLMDCAHQIVPVSALDQGRDFHKSMGQNVGTSHFQRQLRESMWVMDHHAKQQSATIMEGSVSVFPVSVL